MAKILGYEAKVYKRFTCGNCAAIVEYTPSEVKETNRTDEGTRIVGLNCPGCGIFVRTNP